MKVIIRPSEVYKKKDFFKIKEIPISIIHVEDGFDYPLHAHEFVELVYILGGTGKHLVTSGERDISQGDVILINKNIKHGYKDCANLNYINILFEEDMLCIDPQYSDDGLERFLTKFQTSANGVTFLRLSPIALYETIDLINKIDQEMVNKKMCHNYLCYIMFVQLLILLFRKSQEQIEYTYSTRSRIKYIIEQIDKDPSINYSVEFMAKKAETCERNFRKIFKEETGLSPVLFINKKRIDRSLGLLTTTDRSITQIALLLGYQDSSYFSKQFHAFINISPREYRQTLKTK